ncbi:EAL domain-containing protein [Paroceanicella profunda]|uniref:EAL domain-containing protein n=1 Tax=Paroceanicella profunda TaxID=2579971 RepID=A0A5B8FY86_9RHOB|nr:EAL domain-containing protein [Paroceanicella profunda]QDL91113.1 EAL domain-containing protein [Paroceanicella profunda]
MTPLLTFLTRIHDPAYVVLALVALGVTTFTTFFCIAQGVRGGGGASQRLWLVGAVICAGLGVWGTHFTAMIGYRPDLPLFFRPEYAVGSAAASVGGLALALVLAARLPERLRVIGGGLAAGGAVWSLHHIGFSGFSGCLVQFDWLTSGLALVICCVGCGIATNLALRDRAGDLLHAALAFSLAVLVVHFLSVSGTRITFTAVWEGGYSRAEMSRLQYGEALLFGLLICCLTVAQFRSMVRLRRLELAVRYAGDGILILDPRRRTVWANQAFETLSGFSFDEMEGRTPDQLLAPPGDMSDEGASGLLRTDRSGPVTATVRIRKRDGGVTWCAVNSTPVRDSHGRLELLIETVRDITAELTAARRLAHSRAVELRLTRFAANTADLVCMWRPEGGIIWANQAFLDCAGHSLDRALGRDPDQLLDLTEPCSEGRARRQETLSREGRVIFEAQARAETLWLSRTDLLHEDEDDGACVVTICRDITREKMRERALHDANRQMARQARHDLQSGLPNWRRVTEFMVDCGETGSGFTLILLGLDDFRQVIDTFGHVSSHNILRRAGEALSAEFGASCLVGRSGGDELALVLPDTVNPEDATTALGLRAIEVLQRSIPTSGGICRLCASAGIRVVDGTGTVMASALVKDAALALQEARSLRKAVAIFSPGLEQRNASRIRIGAGLVAAVEQRAFEPFFQPQVTLEEGALVGFECLARWRIDAQTVHEPSAFLDFAERGGLLVEIERMILARALDSLRDWRREGLAVPRLSINASVQHLRRPDFVTHLKWELDRRDLAPPDLAVEVLETMLITDEDDPAARNIARLHDAGFVVELDDFGTGHAALANLSRLRIHSVKLDRSLVAPLAHDARMTAIVRAILSLARELDIAVIAEGAETAADLVRLRELGCRVVQGYGIARPMSAEAAHAWLAERETALRRIG